MIKPDPAKIAQWLNKEQTSYIHFLYHFERYLDRSAAAHRSRGDVKIGRTLIQAAIEVRFALMITLVGNYEEIDIIVAHHNKKAKLLAKYYVKNFANSIELMRLLQSHAANIYVEYRLQCAITFIEYADKVLKRTTKPKARQEIKPKRPG